MDPEVILPTPDEPILLKLPTILPEKVGGWTVTFYYHDHLRWVARAQSDLYPTIQVNAPTEAEVRTLILQEIQ